MHLLPTMFCLTLMIRMFSFSLLTTYFGNPELPNPDPQYLQPLTLIPAPPLIFVRHRIAELDQSGIKLFIIVRR